MRRRLFAIIMALTMVISILPATAMAEEVPPEDQILEEELTTNSDLKDESAEAEPQVEDPVASIGDQEFETLAQAIAVAEDGDTVELLKSFEESFPSIDSDIKLTVDLNDNTLTIPGSSSVVLSNGADLTLYNGSITAKEMSVAPGYGTNSLFNILTGSAITLDNVDLDTTGSALFPQGDAASVTVKNGSSIMCGVYAVATNAAATDNYQVAIMLEDSSFTSTYGYTTTYSKDSCPVMINVEGTLDIDNCTISGTRQGVVVRAGTASISNSTITSTGECEYDYSGYPNNWGSGTEVPQAALVVGNYQNGAATAYLAEASLTLTNTAVTAEENIPALYVDANQTYKGVVSISGSDTSVSGSIDNGQYTDKGQISITITGGTFSSEVSDEYMPAGYTCMLDETSGKYVVGISETGEMEVTAGEDSTPVLDGIYKGDETTIEGSGAAGDQPSTATDGNVFINLTTDVTGPSATSASLTVTEQAAASLADNGANSLTVQTDVGSVKLDSAALDKVGDAQSDVVISIEKDKTSVAFSTASYTVEVKSGDNNLLPEGESGNGEITITIPYPQGINSQENLFVYYIKNSIPYQRMEDAELTDDGKNITFTTTHLSQYAVYGAEPAVDYEATVTDAAGVATPYSTLAEAISKAQDGDTVTLWKSTKISNTTINKGIILDLNQNTLSLTGNDATRQCLSFTSGDSVIENGTIIDARITNESTTGYIMAVVSGSGTSLSTSNVTLQTYRPATDDNYTYVLQAQAGAQLTLNSGTRIIDEKLDNVSNEEHGVTTWGAVGVTVLGQGTTLTVNNGAEIRTMGFAICGNGSNNDDASGTKIVVNGGTITSTHSHAIYHPQIDGELTINGGIITGITGIEMRAGALTVNNGSITATASEFSCDANGNGTTTGGAAIAIAQHTTKKDIKVTILGGTFAGVKALNESNPQANDPAPNVDLSVEGGEYIGEITVADVEAFVEAGSFSQPVNEAYLSEELTVELKKSSGQTPYSYYPSVDEALEAAGAGDQITDLSDQSGDSPEPVQVVTVTYDNGGHGTAPAGCKVLAGATITLENMSDADGYLFAGWSDGDTTYQSGAEVTVNMNTTFTAVWKVVAKPTAVRYIVEHYLEGRWGYELEDTEFFTGKIGDTVTAQPKDYPGYRYNERISTASGTLTAIEDEGDIVTLKLYYDERTTSRPSGGSSEPSYTVSVEDLVNGTVETDPRRAQEGEEVTITVTPDDGYELDTLTVIDRDGDEVEVTEERDGTFTFEMPDSRVTIEATFVPVAEDIVPEIPTDWANPYADVAANAWYYDAVAYVAANGLMTGTSAITFAPDATTTRAMIWTVLARMNGQNVDGGTPWYALAQSWAVTANVSDGTNPADPISREELATMLYRAAGSPAVSGNLLSYPDGGAVSAWAESAMLWATQNGIISGIDGMLTPQGQATRAQVATMLMRFREVVIH